MVKRAQEAINKSMRDIYCDTMIEMATSDPRVVALDADLMSPLGMTKFQKRFPERMIDCGVQEANMAGISAGMSARGLIPFMHSFACFASRKCIDQLFLSAGFANLNVKVIGSDPGIMALYNGASHMALEDMGILKNIPNMTLIEPTDAAMLRSILLQVKDVYGLHYIRFNRKEAPAIYEESSEFEIGRGLLLKDGIDATIITSGIMVSESLKAADILEYENTSVQVVNIFTWKPIDEELIVACARKTGAIVTVENHNALTGLGSSVAIVLSEHCPVPFGRIGVQNSYGEVGDYESLTTHFHLTPSDIAKKVQMVIAKKMLRGPASVK